jgi:3-hydroxyacyl-[acyl-carrier-protein] dehydratase
VDNLLIEAILPHRYPFLFVDRVDAIDPGRRIVTTRAVSHDDRYLVADARGDRWLPTSLLIESVAQAGALLVLSAPAWRGRLVFFAGIDRARVRGAVRAGEEARIEVSLQRMIGPVGRMVGIVRVGRRQIARGRITFAIGPRPPIPDP